MLALIFFSPVRTAGIFACAPCDNYFAHHYHLARGK